MDEDRLDELRAELEALEAVESRISSERRRLHHQIDYGFASPVARAREREVSDERRRLHRRIDSIRELVGAEDPAASCGEEPDAPEPTISRLSQWTGISLEAVAADHAQRSEHAATLL